MVSSIVSDIPISPSEKKYMHILHNVASGLHSRNQQMSCLNYGIGLILLHGGCTLTVSIYFSYLNLNFNIRSSNEGLYIMSWGNTSEILFLAQSNP